MKLSCECERWANKLGSILISVLVPALNEQDTIREVIERLLSINPPFEIVVIDDGSTDLTPSILAEYQNKIVVVTRPSPGGKGAAIRHGLLRASGELVVIQDADLEYSPEEIQSLADPIIAGEANIVYGTRFKTGMPIGMALPNKIVNRMLATAVRLLYRQKITDEATCYKVFKRTTLIAMELKCTGFEFCPEVTAKASRMGYKIEERPISYVPRSKNAGKKIRWTDAPIAFWTLAKYILWKPNN